jgi:hypothetical protein
MRMIELMHGVWAVERGAIPEDQEFYRFKPRKEGEFSPLKHICERSDDPTQQHPTDILVFTDVAWCYARGFYYCQGCKQIFDSEEDLAAIWIDGKGTGHEGRA